MDSLYGNHLRLFAPAGLHEMLALTGVEVVAEQGVRVFFDYVALQNPTDTAYSEIFELESKLGARPEFFAIARYIQEIARRSPCLVHRGRRNVKQLSHDSALNAAVARPTAAGSICAWDSG